MRNLLHQLITAQACARPEAPALVYLQHSLHYAALDNWVSRAASVYRALGLGRGERVAVYMEKRLEAPIAMFGAAAAGGVFVPVNPLLKAEQVAYILRDCNVRILVTTAERLEAMESMLANCPELKALIVVGPHDPARRFHNTTVLDWDDAISGATEAPPHRVIDTDMVAIFYTSGSTGKPKGVVLTHRNMVAGARSVAEYLENNPGDRLLAALPLSFDAGFSQLTTAFQAGASAVLLNYLMPRDIIAALERHAITGLTAVPPLWIQLAQQKWPERARKSLRYIGNTGGRMPKATLDALRAALPSTLVFLMYGLTESFRSTYLPPSELDRRPDSIGKAIPNAEVLVVREDGSLCGPNEPGELVHRGALVSRGYWNDPEKTAERFKAAPGQAKELVMPEIAVWSGDTVRRDEEGFLYFIGRRDEMIKTSGYRVSPTEVEEVIYSTGLVKEAAALGIAHPVLGQAIVVVATPPANVELDTEALLAQCRVRLPGFMVPARIVERNESLPRNPNGKIDRKALAQDLQNLFEAVTA